MCTLGSFPTLWHVAAHHRHVALVYQVSQRHVPAGCSAFSCVAAFFPSQVVDVDDSVCFPHHSYRIVGASSN